MVNRMDLKKPTSFDVAEIAGVSQSTVSRALSNSSNVTAETRKRVLDAANELGYVVDQRAAQLRKGKSTAVAVVVIGRAEDTAHTINPFYYSLLGSICAAAAKRSYQTLISFHSPDDPLAGRFEERGQADGLIVIGTATNISAWKSYRKLVEEGRSIVFWSSPFDDTDWIRADNRKGGALAAEELLSAGCERPVFIGSLGSKQRQFDERYDGFRDYLGQSGREPIVHVVDDTIEREAQGAKAIHELVEAGTEFDGVCAASDAIALGALKTLTDLGYSVPEDCPVIGFDGIDAGKHCTPPLSTIEPDFEIAGQMLVDALLGHDERASRRVPVRLLRRGSTVR